MSNRSGGGTAVGKHQQNGQHAISARHANTVKPRKFASRCTATPAEFLERYYYGWIREERGDLPEALDQFIRALQAPVRDERRLPQLYLNIARVSSAMGNKAQARWAAKAAIALIEIGEEDARTRRIREQVQQYLN